MQNAKILVVEDERIQAMDIKRRLEHWGYEVPTIASSGEEAIKKALKLKPDLVLMDIILKGEVNGIEASQKISDRLDIPVVYLTAHPEESMVQRAKMTESYGYILKPFDERELRITIEMALHKHKINKKLRESERSYRTLSENIPGIVYRVLIRKGWEMQFFNEMVKEMTGFSPEELGHGEVCSIDPLIVPEDRENVIKTVKNSIESKEPFMVDYRIKHKDGSVRYFREQGKPVYGDDGEPLHIDGVIFDITETKNFELELEDAYKKWNKTFNAIEEGICFVDTDGTIKQCNSAMEKLLGKSCNEFLGRKCWEVVHGSDEPIENCPIVRMKKSKKRETLELPIDDKWFSVSSDPILDEKGELIGAVHILTDITLRIQNEEKIERLSKLYNTLSQINQSIVRIKDREELFKAICKIFVEQGKFKMVWIGLVDPKTGNVNPVAHYGYEDGYLEKISININDRASKGKPTILAIKEGRVVVIEDIKKELKVKWQDEALKRGYGSLVSIPLKLRGDVIGNLNVYASKPYFFTEEEVKLAKEIRRLVLIFHLP